MKTKKVSYIASLPNATDKTTSHSLLNDLIPKRRENQVKYYDKQRNLRVHEPIVDFIYPMVIPRFEVLNQVQMNILRLINERKVYDYTENTFLIVQRKKTTIKITK